MPEVTISLDVYNELLSDSVCFQMILREFYNDPDLICDELHPGSGFYRVMRFVDPDTYRREVEKRKEKENE